MTKRKTILSLIANILIVVLTAAIVCSYFSAKPSLLVQSGFGSFRYFTTDSNVLVAIAALVTAVCDIRILAKKTDTIPKAALMFKFVGTACVMLTMIVTILFLVPVYGGFVFRGTLIIVHAVTPLLAVLSFAFLETVHHIKRLPSLAGVVPMMLYGIVYYIEVRVIGEENGGWKDFYMYNRGGQWFLSLFLLTAGCFAVTLLTAFIHNLVLKHTKT